MYAPPPQGRLRGRLSPFAAKVVLREIEGGPEGREAVAQSSRALLQLLEGVRLEAGTYRHPINAARPELECAAAKLFLLGARWAGLERHAAGAGIAAAAVARSAALFCAAVAAMYRILREPQLCATSRRLLWVHAREAAAAHAAFGARHPVNPWSHLWVEHLPALAGRWSTVRVFTTEGLEARHRVLKQACRPAHA